MNATLYISRVVGVWVVFTYFDVYCLGRMEFWYGVHLDIKTSAKAYAIQKTWKCPDNEIWYFQRSCNFANAVFLCALLVFGIYGVLYDGRLSAKPSLRIPVVSETRKGHLTKRHKVYDSVSTKWFLFRMLRCWANHTTFVTDGQLDTEKKPDAPDPHQTSRKCHCLEMYYAHFPVWYVNGCDYGCYNGVDHRTFAYRGRLCMETSEETPVVSETWKCPPNDIH